MVNLYRSLGDLSSYQNNLLERLKKDTSPLDDFINGKIFRGIITGFNEAFIIDTATKDRLCKINPGSEEVFKPILRGEDINRYEYNWQGLWGIIIPAGWTNKHRNNSKPEVFIKQTFPAIYNYLKSVQEIFTLEKAKTRRKGLYNRDDQGNYWWELRPCVYSNSFALPKIIWGNLATSASFSFDTGGYYVSAPACMIPTDHKWLLALLNSSVSTFFLRNTAIERQGGFIEQKPIYVKQIPVPNVNDNVRDVLTEKVDTLLKRNSEKQELNKQALEVLRSEYTLPKITQKLENFLNLGWNEFIEELGKQKVSINLSQKDTLNIWFRDKQQTAKTLNESIEQLNKEIDIHIYNLYELNDAEIKLIERENSIQ